MTNVLASLVLGLLLVSVGIAADPLPPVPPINVPPINQPPIGNPGGPPR